MDPADLDTTPNQNAFIACQKCHRFKPVSEFHQRNNGKLTKRCIKCYGSNYQPRPAKISSLSNEQIEIVIKARSDGIPFKNISEQIGVPLKRLHYQWKKYIQPMTTQ